MKKLFLSTALALLMFGFVSISPTQARPWRWGGYYYGPSYNYRPSYYYAPPAVGYYGPNYGWYARPRLYVGIGGWRWR